MNKNDNDRNLREIVDILLKYYGSSQSPQEFLAIKALKENMHPFGILVSIILTQNTSDKNALAALNNLIKELGTKLDPASFESIDEEKLAELIRPSGMHRIKARTILNLLRELNDESILIQEDPSKLRDILTSIKGVGPKTADVFLLTYRKYPTFPIDTHIRRVLYRIGFISRNQSYESIRKKVMEALPHNLLLPAHLVLITHGRRTCKAFRPRCEECPIRTKCKRNGLK